MKKCRIESVVPPKARCACGKEFEVDAYNREILDKTKQEDLLLDTISAHLKEKAGNAKTNQ